MAQIHALALVDYVFVSSNRRARHKVLNDLNVISTSYDRSLTLSAINEPIKNAGHQYEMTDGVPIAAK